MYNYVCDIYINNKYEYTVIYDIAMTYTTIYADTNLLAGT